MSPNVLISDALSPSAVQIFKDRGIEVDFQPKLGADKERLAQLIGDFDGLAIRSATKVTPKVLEKAKRLKVIGRAGIGVDNVDIPAATANRAIGLKMNAIAYDPFLSPEHAAELGVEKVDLAELLRRADFVTLHTPLTDKTRGIIDAKAIAAMKKGVRIINCARGGLVDENALRAALDSGHVAGAAFDVFTEEPATNNPLFGHPNVVCTPHLGAATTEAQENVALQIAEQMSDYLLRGAIANAV